MTQAATNLISKIFGNFTNQTNSDDIVDIEDLGSGLNKINFDTLDNKIQIHKNNNKKSIPDEPQEPVYQNHQEMVDDRLRTTLTKQGYKVVGSHAGVKLCRWTKSMLRNQGGCYKHTFYGIASHQCMECTPNLACANKCVFCWRHQRNPTGTKWNWKLDNAETVYKGLIEQHKKMVKQFKGVPGVTPESFAQGAKIRHAALSLVGEPIMYPEINKFLKKLHDNGISSFLVTNGSFPDQIRDVIQCTQIYLSVDAATAAGHKKVDRPLFKDGWDRFIGSVKNLANRKERTVFRLTIVKGWNDDDLENYAKLVLMGKPNFIEIKGVTYCGTSWAGNTDEKTVLGMKNVPFHEEIVEMCQKLVNVVNQQAMIEGVDDKFHYEIYSQHAHSNCVCIGNRRKFFIDGKWHGYIDFDKFIELNKQKAAGKIDTIHALDYSIENPEWTIYGHESDGFSPYQTRVYRKGANKKAQSEVGSVANLNLTKVTNGNSNDNQTVGGCQNGEKIGNCQKNSNASECCKTEGKNSGQCCQSEENNNGLNYVDDSLRVESCKSNGQSDCCKLKTNDN